MNYLRDFITRRTPQSEPIPGAGQVRNDAGGFGWAIDDWARLDRFLILGAEGGTYYVGQRQLVRENAQAVRRCIAEDGPRLVERVAQISEQGRAPKNDPALFALALAMAEGDAATKRAAAAALPRVARTGTHLAHFVQYATQFRGWGKTLRRAVAAWYTVQDPRRLAFQAVKYQSRDGWAQRDLLRLSHPKVAGAAENAVLRYIVKGELDGETAGEPLFDQIRAVQHLQTLAEGGDGRVAAAAALIRQHRIPRECVPTPLLAEQAVWRALLEDMPLGALVRNVATMTRNGALKPGDYELIAAVCTRLRDGERIRRARLHPLAFLVALSTYASGRGVRGRTTWEPIQDLCDALDDAFYAAFQNVRPIGNRVLVGVDVSGSMSAGTVAGLPGVTPRAGACALALQIARTEPRRLIMGFTGGFVPLAISPRQRLDEVVRYTAGLGFERTDCAQPMLYALKNGIDVDTFVVITDNETWSGDIHPAEALRDYRRRVPQAKLIVIGMTSAGFSIADPRDPGMLDVVGFDAAAPGVIADFARGAAEPDGRVADDEDEDA